MLLSAHHLDSHCCYPHSLPLFPEPNPTLISISIALSAIKSISPSSIHTQNTITFISPHCHRNPARHCLPPPPFKAAGYLSWSFDLSSTTLPGMKPGPPIRINPIIKLLEITFQLTLYANSHENLFPNSITEIIMLICSTFSSLLLAKRMPGLHSQSPAQPAAICPFSVLFYCDARTTNSIELASTSSLV